MFSLVVLFTVFLGLVGILALYSEWQRRKSASSPPQNLQRFYEWLQTSGHTTPTPEQIIAILNKTVVSQQLKSEHEEWSDLEFTSLLPGTALPEFTIKRVEAEKRDTIQVLVRVEWPMCVPGVGVSITLPGGQKVTCHLQVDWMYATVRLQFAAGNHGDKLLLSLTHTERIRMALSCLVVTEGVQNPESLASSVADVIHQLSSGLNFSREPLETTPTPPEITPTPPEPTPPETTPILPETIPTSSETTPTPEPTPVPRETTPVPPETTPTPETTPAPEASPEGSLANPVIPTLLVSGPDEERTEEAGGEEKIEAEKSEESSLSTTTPEVVMDTPTSVDPQQPDDSNIQSEYASQAEENTTTNESEDPISPQSLPISTSTPTLWRRTPSYEQLQRISLPPITENSTLHSSGCNSADMSTSRRAFTLSTSGSGYFGEDSTFESENSFPSTLVYEINDSTRIRHIVALSPAHASKLRRKLSHARKLHIYNDHTFTATHLRQKQKCVVCEGKISGYFGKQGYLCRDCGMIVHKTCHCKVEEQCPNSRVSTMNLIYPESVSTVSSM